MTFRTKTLCTLMGGSHLYNLNTPESDLDVRGVFMHLDPKFILGTKRFDEERKQNDEEDKVLKELSHFCSLIARSNTEAMDFLFCKSSEFESITPEFEFIRSYAYQLIDSKALFNCLRGYMKGERRLMNGERKGKIGGKRYAKLKEVGYSPKNAVQLIRLANVGATFFRTGKYIVDTRQFEHNPLMPASFHNLLMTIKTKPETYSVEEVNAMVDIMEEQIVNAYENRKETYHFDEVLMNKILYKIYMEVLVDYALERSF